MKYGEIPKLAKFAVVGIFGPAGSGKSLLAAVLAEREWQKYNGTRKLLYFPEDFKHIHGSPVSLAQMLTGDDIMNGALMIWDETHVLLNKFRSASHGNRSALGFLSQIRKRGCTLFYTTNSPKQLDRALSEQTTAHCYCEMTKDSICESAGDHHLEDCRDWIKQTWVDTQGKAGMSYAHKDGRKRRQQSLKRVNRFAYLYNTFATVSVEEVGQMDKNAIAAAHDENTLGISYKDFVDRMWGWLPGLIEQEGAKFVTPATFAEFIKKQTKGKITPSERTVGRACKQMGLVRRRQMGGVKYQLPEAAEVHLWKAGLA